jgi:pimeloyl-ACP methyl ester carboxylesterase
MPSIEINGVRIDYLQINCEADNNCEDIVMIHGLATSLAFWYFNHATLFSKRYRITLYDLRGHGRSGVTDSGYSPKNMALDLQLLLSHLAIKRAHFITHSFGGLIALNLACLNPDLFESLVLADTNIQALRKLQDTKKWEYGEKIQQILLQNGLNIDVKDPHFGFKLLDEVAHLQIKDIKISKELNCLISNLMWKNNNHFAKRWIKLMDETRAAQELMDDDLSLDDLRNLNFPIMAMYGELSHTMSTGARVMEVWPTAVFHVIREAGHFFPITRPAHFIENCQHFLDAVQNLECCSNK